MTNTKKSNKKKYYLVFLVAILGVFLVLVVLEVVGATDFYQRTNSTNSLDSQSDNSVDTMEPANSREINYGPPSESDVTNADKNKENITDNETTIDKAEVVIVDATQYDNEVEVRAFVPNVIEKGECTFTFMKDSLVVERKTNAFPDASSTPCISLDLTASDFSLKGIWDVAVKYKGTTTGIQGEANTTIEIK